MGLGLRESGCSDATTESVWPTLRSEKPKLLQKRRALAIKSWRHCETAAKRLGTAFMKPWHG
eukprot:3844710-Amphidinium_carterae.1